VNNQSIAYFIFSQHSPQKLQGNYYDAYSVYLAARNLEI